MSGADRTRRRNNRLAVIAAIERGRALASWAVVTRGLEMLRQAPAISTRQRGRCYLCGLEWFARPSKTTQRLRTRDHVFPRSAGGKGDANILLAHDGCNQAKGDRWPRPCEVIYLAAMYAAPLNRQMVHAMRVARIRAERRVA